MKLWVYPSCSEHILEGFLGGGGREGDSLYGVIDILI
jgi:hypothetical protein